MGKYARYSNTVDSGVKWLGYIPTDWNALPIAALLEERGEMNKGTKTENVLSVLRDIGVIPYDEKGDIGNKKSEDIERYKIVHPGDLVVNSMNVIIGSVGVSAYYGSLSPIYMVLRPRSKNVIHKHFVGYAFQIKTFQRWLKRLGYGILEHRLRIPMDNLKREYLPVPSYETQEHIVDFLDHETAKIDRLIARQERLIELLKEKRQAVISHAVTKGLDPDAPMKDSGVGWLGEVPAHWNVTRLRFVVDGGLVNGLFKKKEHFGSGVRLINVFDVYQDDFVIKSELLDRVAATEEEQLGYRVEPGDIFFVRSSLKLEGVGRSSCVLDVPEPTVFECHLVRTRPKRAFINPWFMNYFLNSTTATARLISLANYVTMATIDQEKIKGLNIPIPPLEEQQEICESIDHQIRLIDKLIGKAGDAILLLREHRTALISAAVTGKIDVRGWRKPDTEPQETTIAVSV